MADIIVSEIKPSLISSIAALGRSVSDPGKTDAYYAWKYFDNPTKRSFGFCAMSEGRAVGNHGSIPIAIQVGDRAGQGAQLVDAMVRREFRREGVFTQLAERTFEEMTNAGVELAFVFPAPVTLKALTQRFGDWVHVVDVPRFLCILYPCDAASAVVAPVARQLYTLWLRLFSLPGRLYSRSERTTHMIIEDIGRFDRRFDDLWAKVGRSFGLSVARTSSYLTWRYASHPEKGYRCLAVLSAGNLVAYAVVAETRPQSVLTWELVELIVDPDVPDAGLALVQAVKERARKAHVAEMAAWMLPHHELYREILNKVGFVHCRSRLVPGRFGYSVPLVVRVFDAELPIYSPLDAANWYVSMGDSDLH